uniref:Zn(2)-C6 fungal-type domain-containing protein n=1 Tax=Fusarium oxysporum (strain Fo5176) TaxID=660025 RepID=A0A0D2XFB8_FUSOF
MDSARAPDSTPRPFRRPRACKGCRTAKVRCSGGEPCQRCVRRGAECIFASDKDFVSVSERYLRDLQQRLFEKEHGILAESASEPKQAPVTSPQGQVEISRSSCVQAAVSITNPASPILSQTHTKQQPSSLTNPRQPVTSSISPITSSITPTAHSHPAEGESQDGDQVRRPRNSLLGSEFAYVHDSQSSLFRMFRSSTKSLFSVSCIRRSWRISSLIVANNVPSWLCSVSWTYFNMDFLPTGVYRSRKRCRQSRCTSSSIKFGWNGIRLTMAI